MNHVSPIARTLAILALTLLSTVAQADIRLPAVIGDNMVLQRNSDAPIWGWADPGERITVDVSWSEDHLAVKADTDGRWKLNITGPPVGKPGRMTLKGENTITLENILAGEVWVCSGQSNMQWTVSNSSYAQEEIAAADYPRIRLFSVERKVADKPQDDCTGSWVECSPETIPGFSAVAYFFGRELHRKLDIPIGLIHTSWGGTPAEAWTSWPMLETDSDFAPILERWEQAVKKYPQAKAEYDKKLEQWKKARAEGKNPGRAPRAPFGPGNPHSPSGLYNAMIAPLIPYAIQGAIWYQGESNASRAYQYRELFPAMIRSWRQSWGRGDFPFLFVQLANFMEIKPEPADSAWAELREAQTMTLGLPNTGMAVIIDIGEANDIHPRNKQDVGKRLALWALARSYGQNVVYSGPMYKSMRRDGNKIILEFDHIGGGLVAKHNDPLMGFAVAGQDRQFVWADVRIVGKTIVVSSEQVPEPVAVRYAWADNPVCNLYSEAGLPASPFRTDDWKGVTGENR
jgi:sialate O-acetylesterase